MTDDNVEQPDYDALQATLEQITIKGDSVKITLTCKKEDLHDIIQTPSQRVEVIYLMPDPVPVKSNDDEQLDIFDREEILSAPPESVEDSSTHQAQQPPDPFDPSIDLPPDDDPADLLPALDEEDEVDTFDENAPPL